MKTILMSVAVMVSFAVWGASEVMCGEVGFGGHLQGIATDGTAIYWSFYDTILKTDFQGRKLKAVAAAPHAGDICVTDDGRVCVSMSIYGQAELARRGGRRGWIFVYDRDLNPVREVPVPESNGVDGITFHRGVFYVGGGSRGYGPKSHLTNSIIRLDREFKFIEDRDVTIGVNTSYGVQTINVLGGKLVVSFYAKNGTRVFDPETLTAAEVFPADTTTGAIPVPRAVAGADNVIAVARAITTSDKKHTAKLTFYRLTDNTIEPWTLSSERKAK